MIKVENTLLIGVCSFYTISTFVLHERVPRLVLGPVSSIFRPWLFGPKAQTDAYSIPMHGPTPSLFSINYVLSALMYFNYFHVEFLMIIRELRLLLEFLESIRGLIILMRV